MFPAFTASRIRKLLFIFFVLSFLFLSPDMAGAQNEYEPLAPIPGISGSATVAEYFTAIYQIAISAVLVIAVVMFIIGGIQYMTSDSIAGKGGGRDTIAKALIGILLATGSYLLLFIIGGEGSVRVGFNMPKLEFVGPVDSQEGEGPVGSPQACFDGRESDPSMTEEYNFCTGGHRTDNSPEGIVFKLRDYDGSVGCDGVSYEDAEDFATAQCSQQGGRLESYPTGAHGTWETFCVSSNISQCNDIMDNYTPEQACYEEIKRVPSQAEREYSCSAHTASVRGFVLDGSTLLSAVRNISSQCSGQNSDFVIEYAQETCEADGGTFLSPTETGQEAFLCTYANAQCEEQLESAYLPNLSTLTKDQWLNICGQQGGQSNTFSLNGVRNSDLENLYSDMQKSLIGNAYGWNSSGFSRDSEYYDNEDVQTSPYDPRWHTGQDIAAVAGTKIQAPVSGTVVIMRQGASGYDNNDKVAIRTSDGKLWVLTHVQNIAMAEGSYIEAGNQIAEVGAIGAPHVHLEVHNNANAALNNTHPYTGPWGGLNAGRYSPQDTIESHMSCPMQAFWENMNAVPS